MPTLEKKIRVTGGEGRGRNKKGGRRNDGGGAKKRDRTQSRE